MRVRALMVDVDGVIVRHPNGRRWSHRLEADLGITPDDVQRLFFAPHFDDVVLGRADLYERLAPVLATLDAVTAEDFVAYWFANDSAMDEILLADLSRARGLGLELHLATVQEPHRARYLWETLGLREHFRTMHYAADIGWRKTDPDFYRVVEERTGFGPGELCLIDDDPANVETAHACGWYAQHWAANSRLQDVLAALP